MAFIDPRNRLNLVAQRPTLAAARTAIVVDAGCDLPTEFFEQPGVMVLPISVKVGEHEYTDNHSAETTQRFLADNLGGRNAGAETRPYSVKEIRALFLERLVLDYDSVYCLTISAKRSQIYENAMRASLDIIRDSREMRSAAGIAKPFLLRVIDTKNVFAGQGIPALDLADMINRGMAPRDITPRLFKIVEASYGYFVPDDLYYLRTRAKKSGDRSVGLVGAMLGSTLDIKPLIRAHMGVTTPVAKMRGRDTAMRKLFRFAGERVQTGLLTPHVNVSYGGSLEELRALPGYHELAEICAVKRVALHESIMSITGCVNVGPRGVTVAFAAPPHELLGF
ncbi:MAG: DegV family protein [Dokdonella sp.]